MRISMSKSAKKRSPATTASTVAAAKPVAADEGSRRRLEAITRHRHATNAGGCSDCGDDEGYRLAAALGARLSCGVVRKRLKLKLASKTIAGTRV
jgi:hypothetical protein